MRKLKLFNWRGINRLQQKQKGTIVAESAVIAQQQLMSRGLQHIKLQQNWQLNSKPKNAEVVPCFLSWRPYYKRRCR